MEDYPEKAVHKNDTDYTLDLLTGTIRPCQVKIFVSST